MVKIKYICIFLLFFNYSVFSDTHKVYFYTSDNNINNYKSLKISFEEYLSQFGEYEFQAFSDQKTFEKYLESENIIVILSSWHYMHITDLYNIKAKLVAKKKHSIKDTKVIVGKKNTLFKGTIATSYSKEYTNELLKNINTSELYTVEVPKEIDALMSVGFGMSQFAVVSKDSFDIFSKLNKVLSKNMKIYSESKPSYRMLVATNIDQKYKKILIEMFSKMKSHNSGKKVLSILGIDKIVSLKNEDIQQLGATK